MSTYLPSLISPLLYHTEVSIGTEHVGRRVSVKGYGDGTLRFYGPHKVDGFPRCGIELDKPLGKNNGTVGVSLRFSSSVEFVACFPVVN